MGWINGCAGCCAPYTLCTAVLLLVLSHCMEHGHWTFTVLAAKHNWSLVEKAQCCRNAATFYFCVSALMWVLFFNVHGWVLSCLRGVVGRRRNAVAYEMLLTAGGTPSYLTRSDGEDDDEDEGSVSGNARGREMFFRVRGGATNLLHTDGVEVLTRSEAAGGGRAFSPLREPRRRTTPTPRAVTEEDVDDFRSDVDMNEGGANLEYKRSILNSEMERQQRQQQISSVTAWSSGQRRPARRGYRNNNNNNNSNNRSNEPLPDHTALALPRRQRGAGGGEYSKSINEPQSPT